MQQIKKCTYMYKYVYIYIYIYLLYETRAWTPNSLIFVKDCCGVSVVQLQVDIYTAFLHAKTKCWVVFGLRHLGLGIWQPAILKSRLWAAVLRHLG